MASETRGMTTRPWYGEREDTETETRLKFDVTQGSELGRGLTMTEVRQVLEGAWPQHVSWAQLRVVPAPAGELWISGPLIR